jgi:hypothetical protein
LHLVGDARVVFDVPQNDIPRAVITIAPMNAVPSDDPSC